MFAEDVTELDGNENVTLPEMLWEHPPPPNSFKILV